MVMRQKLTSYPKSHDLSPDPFLRDPFLRAAIVREAFAKQST